VADDVSGQPGSVAGIRAKKTRGVRVARVGVCGHVGRRFFAGFSPVDSSRLPLHDGMFKNTFGELLFLGLDQTPSFSRTSSNTSCWDIQAIKHTQFTWFGNLPTPRSYWFVLIKLRNNTNNKTRRRRKNSSLLNSTLSSSLSLSLCFSLFRVSPSSQ
jgi:hypothetical protein